MPSVVRSIDIDAPPSAVWIWLASQEALRQWFPPTIEIDLRVGGTYRMLGADGETTVSGTILELQAERRFVLSWLEEDAGWAHPARLAIELEATATGARVTLTHDGFEGVKPDWERLIGAYERGADRHRLLEKLADLMAATVA